MASVAMNNNTQLALPLTFDAGAGSRVIVAVLKDEVTAPTCSDPGGNTYAIDKSIVGTTHSIVIFSSVITTPLVASDVLMLSYPSFNGTVIATAAVLVGGMAGAPDRNGAAIGTSTAPDTGPLLATTSPREMLVGVFGWTGNIALQSVLLSLLVQASSGGGPSTRTLGVAYTTVNTTGVYRSAATLAASAPWTALVVTYPLP